MANVTVVVTCITLAAPYHNGVFIEAKMSDAQIWDAIQEMWGHMTEQQIIERLRADHPEWWQA